MRRFKGFTLTELMIALAVLGIIVAVVTPAIMRTRPDKNKMMIKKSYYVAEQVVSSLINDEYFYPDKNDLCRIKDASGNVNSECRWGFDDESSVSYEGQNIAGETKFKSLFVDKLNIKLANEGGYQYLTTDGIYWDLGGTIGKWAPGASPASKVGNFDQCETADSNSAGCGVIKINVEGKVSNDNKPSHADNIACDGTNDECNYYEIQVLANGKMRIDPEAFPTAANYITLSSN